MFCLLCSNSFLHNIFLYHYELLITIIKLIESDLEATMSNYNVGQLVSDFLTENKVDTAFGVVSVHNIPMLDAIAKTNRIKL